MASKTSNWKLTGQVIDCAMKVHSELGSGFQEAVYQRALGSEMMRAGVVFRREVDLPIIYKGQQVGMRRVDFLVADAVMLEIKAVAELNDTHLTQAINYLGVHELQLGLVINFGGDSLDIRRVYNNKPKRRTLNRW